MKQSVKDRKTMVDFLRKVCRQRKFIINSGKSQKNEMKCLHTIGRIEHFLDSYPTIRPGALQNFIRRHQGAIEFLIPHKKGESCSQLDELQDILTMNVV